jgi:hypothetical protein
VLLLELKQDNNKTNCLIKMKQDKKKLDCWINYNDNDLCVIVVCLGMYFNYSKNEWEIITKVY